MLNQTSQKIKLFEHQRTINPKKALSTSVFTSTTQLKFPNHISIKVLFPPTT